MAKGNHHVGRTIGLTIQFETERSLEIFEMHRIVFPLSLLETGYSEHSVDLSHAYLFTLVGLQHRSSEALSVQCASLKECQSNPCGFTKLGSEVFLNGRQDLRVHLLLDLSQT